MPIRGPTCSLSRPRLRRRRSAGSLGPFSKPCLLNKAHSAHDLSLKTLEEMGYAIVIFPSATLLGAIEGSFRMCKSLLEEGKQMPVKDLPGGAGGLNQFFGLERYQELERKFS